MFRRGVKSVDDKLQQIRDGFKRISAKSSRYDGLKCQNYDDDDDDPLEKYMIDYNIKRQEPWEKINQDGLNLAIRKYTLDHMICQIAQNGLYLAHADPKKFNFKDCLEWKANFEKEYFDKYQKKFVFHEVLLNDDVKNKICSTKEYQVYIEIGSKSSSVANSA